MVLDGPNVDPKSPKALGELLGWPGARDRSALARIFTGPPIHNSPPRSPLLIPIDPFGEPVGGYPERLQLISN